VSEQRQLNLGLADEAAAEPEQLWFLRRADGQHLWLRSSQIRGGVQPFLRKADGQQLWLRSSQIRGGVQPFLRKADGQQLWLTFGAELDQLKRGGEQIDATPDGCLFNSLEKPASAVVTEEPAAAQSIESEEPDPTQAAVPEETEEPTYTLLDLASRILPRKVVAEYIGDREEVLRRMAAEDCPRWKLRVEVASCVFWAVVFTLREFVAPAAILGALGKWLGM
jgi:hypothetical protein